VLVTTAERPYAPASRMRRWFPLILAALLGGLPACRKSPETASAKAQVFPVVGTVRELKPDGQTIVIQHEAISNYMEAMTMPFRVRDQALLQNVHAGDRVRFQLHVTEDQSWIEQLVRIGTASLTNAAPLAAASPTNASTNATKEVEFYLSNIPDFALTNEFGQPLSLRQFTGKAVTLTFFFTRCPIPEYCPRLTKNFQGAIQRLKDAPGGPTNFHFLSISFDPIDTPLLLRAYGVRNHYDSNHWSFVTGQPDQIRELARGFGVPITPDGANFNHGFRTAVFDANGKLQSIWPIGGDLTDHIVGEVAKAARVQPRQP